MEADDGEVPGDEDNEVESEDATYLVGSEQVL